MGEGSRPGFILPDVVQAGDRCNKARGCGNWRGCCLTSEPHPIHPQQPGNVLQFGLADILKIEIEAAGRVFLYARRNAYALRLRDALKPRGNVNPVAENIAVFDYDVALMYADVELNSLRGRNTSVLVPHAPLNATDPVVPIDYLWSPVSVAV
jgi:hypothetical protein